MVRHPRERAQPCVGKTRGKTSLRNALDQNRSQGKAEHGWCCHLPRGLSTQGCSGKGGNHSRWGGCLGPPQEILPEGRSQPTPHLSDLAALAHHRPSMGSAAVSQTSSIRTAVTPTATSPGSLQDPRTGDNWVLPPWLQD